MSEEEFNDYMEDIDTIIDNYKKENEELQERFDRLTQEHIEKIDRVNELRERIDKAIRYVNLLEKALIERDVTIDYILLDTARQLLEENIEIPEITIKYLRGDKE